MTKRRVIRYIDLFAGAGGLSQGFRQASDARVEYRSVYAVEMEPSFAASYAANFGDHVFARPVERVRREDLPLADLIIGGPPCQGFSPLGKMSPTKHHADMNELWRHYFRILGWVRPAAFVVENVPEFLASDEFPSVERAARRLGYRISRGVLNAADFGVPQLRRRGFVVGVLDGEPRLPMGDRRANGSTVRDAIGRLVRSPLVYDFENGTGSAHPARDLHIGRNPTKQSLVRYRCVPPGGNRFDLMRRRPDLTPRCWLEKKSGSTDVFGRLEWDKPALTIRTEFFKPEKGRYLHPELHRPITHWEAARLQSFPDDYLFCGSKIEIARQIGNAVPPKLAEAVARELTRTLLGEPPALPHPPLSHAEQLVLLND